MGADSESDLLKKKPKDADTDTSAENPQYCGNNGSDITTRGSQCAAFYYINNIIENRIYSTTTF